MSKIAATSRYRVWVAALWMVSIGVWLGAPGYAAAAPGESALAALTADDGAAEEGVEEEEKVGTGDILPQLADLKEAEREATRTLENLSKTASMEDDAATRERLVAELAEYLEQQRASRVQGSRLSAIRERMLVERERVDLMLGDLTGRLHKAGEITADFRARGERWQTWRTDLRTGPEFKQLLPAFNEARTRVNAVIELAPKVSRDLLALQQRLLELDGAALDLVEAADVLFSERKRTRLERGAPSVVSLEYWSGLSQAWAVWSDALSTRGGIQRSFFERVWGVMLFHVGLWLGIVLIARKIGAKDAAEEWSLLDSPVALGGFAATAVSSVLYEPMPMVWEFLVWLTLAASGLVLGRAGLRPGREQTGLAMLATAYPVFLLLDLLGPPQIILRVVRTALYVAGAWIAWRWGAPKDTTGGKWFLRLLLRGGAVVLAGSAGLDLVGYATMARYLTDSLVVSGFIAFATLIIARLLGQSTSATPADTSDMRLWERILRRTLHRGAGLVRIGVIIVAASYVGYAWELVPSPLEVWRLATHAFSILGIKVSGEAVLLAAIILGVAMELSWVVQAALESGASSGTSKSKASTTSPQTVESVKRLAHYALLTVGVLLALTAVGVELSSLALIAGALGVGIGFGLQNIAHDVVSGLVLLFERPVRIGDVVVIDQKFGTVKSIGLRSTVIMLLDRTDYVVPNRKLTDDALTNWTLSGNAVRLFVPVGVAYGSDLEAVFETLAQVGKDHEAVVAGATEVLYLGFGDSALNFELRVRIRNPHERLTIQSQLLRAVDLAFRERKIEIAYPQRDLHLRSVDASVLRALRGDEQRADPPVEAPAAPKPEAPPPPAAPPEL